MALQDRDYYREKHISRLQSNGFDTFDSNMASQASKRRGSGIYYLLYIVITSAALWYGAYAFLNYQGNLNPIAPPAAISKISEAPVKQKPLKQVSKPIILKVDSQGHFRGTAFINNVEMPFLIDTGATKTSVPAKMAIAAGLPLGDLVQSHTAGGQVTDHLTRINSLKIGNAEIKNLDANINQYLDEVLIGMNTLKYFQITQSGDTLTLLANNRQGSDQALNQSGNKMPVDVLVSDQPVKKPFNLKKTVTCDEHKFCVTAYSNR